MAKIGDLVNKSGVYTKPGVVIEKKDDGNLVIDTDPMAVNKYHRYINTTGLTEGEKAEFNTILDQIYQKESNMDRLNDIQTEIDRLKMDPQSKNIVQYLRNQQSHLIREAKALPQKYQVDENQLKR